MRPPAKSLGQDAAPSRDYQAIIDGRSRARGILVDHREAPPDTDMSDERSLVDGLRYAYGDSRGDRELLAAAQHPAYRPFHGI